MTRESLEGGFTYQRLLRVDLKPNRGKGDHWVGQCGLIRFSKQITASNCAWKSESGERHNDLTQIGWKRKQMQVFSTERHEQARYRMIWRLYTVTFIIRLSCFELDQQWMLENGESGYFGKLKQLKASRGLLKVSAFHGN